MVAWGWRLLWLVGVQWANYASITGLASAQTVTLTSSVEQAGRQAACPGEVTFTCTVTERGSLQWIAEPHINQSNPVIFAGASVAAGETRDPTPQIHIVLDEVNGSDPRLRDYVSTLTVRNSTALSGTVIQCSDGRNTINNSLIVGTPPSSPRNARSGDVGYNISDFTVAVQWESPASGGVGIDIYTLTGAGITVPLTVLSNQPLMTTLTLLYNEMHMVSITASNCAGKSTATLVTIQEVGCGSPTPPPRGSLGGLTSSQEGAVVAFQCNPGLVPSQQMMSVCMADGSWTPDPAELVCRGDCGVPASPTNGTVAYTTTTVGSQATFQCSAGLVPVVLMAAVCENSGGVARWSPDPGDLSCVDVPVPCNGALGSLSCDDVADGTCYTASYAVQPDDSVTFIVSARTPANTWVGLGVSDDRFMPNTDIVLGAADGINSFIHDRFAFAQDEPPVDPCQDIESASAERVDGVTTITFNRPRNSSDRNDISLDECRFFLFAYGGRAGFVSMPPTAIYHGPGPTRRAASLERICISTFTECSAGDCGVPVSPTDGTVAYTTTTEGSLATFQCSAGLVPGEVMTAVCENSGGVAHWSPDPGDLSCVMSTMGQAQGLSTAEAVGIAIALASIVSFSAGLLVALVIAYCYIRQQKSQYSPRDPKQPAPTQASSSLQQGNIELKDNISYGPVISHPPAPQQPAPTQASVSLQQGNIELKDNISYGPVISHPPAPQQPVPMYEDVSVAVSKDIELKKMLPTDQLATDAPIKLIFT